jgi:hypothetical protein
MRIDELVAPDTQEPERSIVDREGHVACTPFGTSIAQRLGLRLVTTLSYTITVVQRRAPLHKTGMNYP